MANEITLFTSAGTDTKGAKIDLRYKFSIPEPATLASGKTVVPSPTSQIDPDMRKILSDSEKDTLNRGEAAIVPDTFYWKSSWNTLEAIDEAKDQYDAAKAEFASNYTDTYRYIGERFDR